MLAQPLRQAPLCKQPLESVSRNCIGFPFMDAMTSIQDIRIPLTFHSLVVEYTSRCNAKCAMCYQAAGPKGSDLIGDAALTTEEIKRMLDDVRLIPEIQRRFHISGGEAFIRPEALFEVFQYAKQLDYFEDIGATTNGYWASKKQRAAEFARRAADCGVTMMEISWDYWHQSYVSSHAVSNCIDACADTDKCTK